MDNKSNFSSEIRSLAYAMESMSHSEKCEAIAQAVKAEQEAILGLLPEQPTPPLTDGFKAGQADTIQRVTAAIKERMGTQG